MAGEIDMDSFLDAILNSAEDYARDFCYQGFNPLIIRQEISKISSYKSDLPMLIWIYITRGTNVTKILGSMSEEGAKTLKRLVALYHLKDSIPPKGGRAIITLGRIAASYPDSVCMTLFKKPNIYTGPIPVDEFPSVPRFMMVPCFAALIPKEEDYKWNCLAGLHLLLMISMDKVINKGNISPVEVLKKYQSIARSSNLLSDPARLAYLEQMDVLEEFDGVYSLTQEFEDLFIAYRLLKTKDAETPPKGFKRPASGASGSEHKNKK